MLLLFYRVFLRCFVFVLLLASIPLSTEMAPKRPFWPPKTS